MVSNVPAPTFAPNLESRVAELLREMTLEEKCAMLAGVDDWHIRGVERLGLPPAFVADCGHGVTLCGTRSSPSTCFPTGIGMASTWNPALLEEAGAVIGQECLSLGVALLLGPKINLHRLPLNGRSFETFSEDPVLAGRLGAAVIRGIQQQGVGSCLKAMAGNNQQKDQQQVSSEISERALRELYLRNFEVAYREGNPCAIMTSYNRLNGDYAAENRWLIQEVIKNEWKFLGLVVSDWRSIFHEKVYRSGLDLEMPGPGKFLNPAGVTRALREGLLTEAELDDKVARILRLLVQYGRAEEAGSEFPPIGDPRHHEVARRVAEESIVLLKNTEGVLPLDRKSVKRLAIIGPNAAEARLGGGGSASVTPISPVSPLEGIREIAGPEVEILYAEGCSLVGTMQPVNHGLEHLSADGKWEPGLRAEFFPAGEPEGTPETAWIVPQVDFSWGWASPGPGVPRSNYAVRFSGRLVPRATGTYRLGVFGQEGVVRLKLDGQTVFEEWPAGGGNFEAQYVSRYRTLEYPLTAGKPVELTLEYGKRAARAAVRLEWEEPGQANPLDAAAELARTADAVVVCAGLSNLLEGGSKDRDSIELPEVQTELIRRVAAANPRTIVVLFNGGPLATPWADEVGALVEAWYPGEAGGTALARILFGDVNPSGKLPDTLAVRLEDHAATANYPGDGQTVHYAEGIFVGYRHFEAAGIRPQFPFGYGLSYTTFEVSPPELSAGRLSENGEVTATVTLRNTGNRAGAETLQLYVRDREASVPRPPKELRAFEKVRLEPGESARVSLPVRWQDLAFWCETEHRWKVEPGEFEVLVGTDSTVRKGARLVV